MKIKLDKEHYLNSDTECYWVTQKAKSEKTGKITEKRVSGYLPTFGQVVESYVERRIRSSEAEKITALKKEIKAIKKTVREWQK